jgi:5-formyltetrahydrofolate cyclo-ligase
MKKKTEIIRERIWSKLVDLALPDSRFDKNFAEYIPDFQESPKAIDRIVEQDFFKSGQLAFITPDNCLIDLRRRMLEAGKSMIISTYGIYRGLWLLEPDMVPKGQELFAAWLDGLEYFGRPITLKEIGRMGRLDFLVTGASAVSLNGVRFGKGHGFFDLEWGMFTELNVVDDRTPVTAVVHDVQVVDEALVPSPTDILVDHIATPEHFHVIHDRGVRPRGIHWELLEPKQIAATPPLQELRRMQGLEG